MGNFYTNVVVRGPTESDLRATLVALNRTGFTVTHPDGFVFVYDEEADTQKQGVVESLALTLATRLRCPALAALNHDDDALLLWLYDREGNETRFGWGVSFDGEERPSSVENFAGQVRRVFGTVEDTSTPDALNSLQMRLLEWFASRFLAVQQHSRLLRLSGIPRAPGMMGYRYIYQGELGDSEPGLTVRSVP
jgi:hypothetical protein